MQILRFAQNDIHIWKRAKVRHYLKFQTVDTRRWK